MVTFHFKKKECLLVSIEDIITFAILFEKVWPVRLGVRTPDFHSGNRGSIPLRATTKENYGKS